MQLPVVGYITTRYNTWVNYSIAGHPTRVVNGATQWLHQAIDIVTDGPTLLISPGNGVVTKLINVFQDITDIDKEDHNFGNEIIITYKNNWWDRFCHCKQNSFQVKLGDTVSKGQGLAYTGQTGFHIPGTVFHTHWERYNEKGERVDPLDPANQLSEDDMTPEQSKQLTEVYEFIQQLKKGIEPIRQNKEDGSFYYDTNIRKEDPTKVSVWADTQALATLNRAAGNPLIDSAEVKNPKYVKVNNTRQLSK